MNLLIPPQLFRGNLKPNRPVKTSIILLTFKIIWHVIPFWKAYDQRKLKIFFFLFRNHYNTFYAQRNKNIGLKWKFWAVQLFYVPVRKSCVEHQIQFFFYKST